jgi:ribosomal protein L37AE/L43A
MQTPLLLTQSSLECPRCSKHAVVSVREGVYQCLHCNFSRKLPTQDTAEAAGSNSGALFFGGFGFLLTLALLL